MMNCCNLVCSGVLISCDGIVLVCSCYCSRVCMVVCISVLVLVVLFCSVFSKDVGVGRLVNVLVVVLGCGCSVWVDFIGEEGVEMVKE